jgi:hypothetical protein
MFGAQKSFALAWNLARGPVPGTAGVPAAGFCEPAGRSRWRRSLSTAKHGCPPASWKNSRSWPPPAPASLQSPQENSITARQDVGKWRGTALSPPRTRKRANSTRPGLCPMISKICPQPAVCARRSRRRRCIAKLRVRRLVFAAIPAKSCRAYRMRVVPAKQGRDRKRDRMRENRCPFAPRRRGLAPSTVFQGRLRVHERRLRHGEHGGAVASRKVTFEGNCGRSSAPSLQAAPRAVAALPRGRC